MIGRRHVGLAIVATPFAARAQTRMPVIGYLSYGDGSDRTLEPLRDALRTRRIEESIAKEAVADGCLLCREDKPHHCHRRLVAEYLQERWHE